MEPRRCFSTPIKMSSEVEFNSSYKQLLSKFQEGDLIFGLKDVRQNALDELRKFGITKCFANALNKRTVTIVVNNNGDAPIDTSELQPYQLKHFEFLSKHRDTLLKPHGKPIPTLAHKGEVRSSAYRRACKLLLTNNDSDRTNSVHVMTEKMDWQRICSKTYRDSLGELHTDPSVTSSEMRAAYRFFKTNQQNHPKIIFYDKDRNVMEISPWEIPEFIPYFTAYDRERQHKIDFELAPTQSPTHDEEFVPLSPTF